jgi:hypothetical protein
VLLTAAAGVIQTHLAPQMESLARDLPAEIIPDVDPVHLL